MSEPELNREAARVLNTIQRVRQLPNFQGYLEYKQLNSQQQQRVGDLCVMMQENPRRCMFGVVDGQVMQVIAPAYHHLIFLTGGK